MCQETVFKATTDARSPVCAASMHAAALWRWLSALLMLLFLCTAFARTAPDFAEVEIRELPPEARQTVGLIRQGGPFPFPKDGSVFGNYEGVLPKQKRGYYHEFTVKTPGARNRGARRIVVGGDWKTSRELYYTSDHYATFRRIKE